MKKERRGWRWRAGWLTWMVLMGVSGCSQTPTFSALLSGQDEGMTSSESEWKTQSGLDADAMFRILMAEMLVQKKQPAQAFDWLFPVAQKYQNPDLVKRCFELSMYTYDLNKIDQATQLWLSLHPQDPTPYKAAYLMALRQDKLSQAWQYWQKYQAMSSAELSEDILSSAQRLVRAVPPKAGEAFFQKMTQVYPDLWASWLGLGWLLAEHQKLEKAYPNLIKAYSLAKQAKDKQAELKSAKVLLEVALKSPKPHAEILDQLLVETLKKYPEQADVQQLVARLQVKLQRFQAAKKTFQTILKYHPETFSAHFGLGVLALQFQRWDEAERHFKYLAKQPRYAAVANYYLGQIAQAKGEVAQAIQFYQKARKGQFGVEAEIALAVLQNQSKGLKAVLAALDKVRAQTPSQKLKLLKTKAKVYEQLGQEALALSAYQQALKLAPKEMSLLYPYSALLYQQKKYQAYEATLKKMLQIAPNEPDLLNALGYFYVEQHKNLAEAGQLIDQALALAPNEYYILDSKGWWYAAQGHYAEAEKWLEKAFKLKHDEEVLRHLIEVKWKLGKKAEARALVKKAQHWFPKSASWESLLGKR